MSLTYKEKELANIGASVATGCKPCTDYHFNKVREAGASDDEVKQAISDAMAVREIANEIMESHGLKHLGIAKEVDVAQPAGQTSRMKELVSVAAAFAVNCTSSVKEHIAAARTVGITEKEIESVLDAALFIKDEAAHYVGQIAKLRQEKNRLQHLLEELEKTQAQLVQAEKMAALGKLVAGVVHEINTPVGAMNSATYVFDRSISNIIDVIQTSATLEDVKNNPRFQESVTALQDNNPVTAAASERITKIVGSLKSFAHLDGARLQNTDLHEGLEDTLTLIEHKFRDKIRVVREFGDIPKVVCNPGELNQVFMNLLDNAEMAIKDKGTITIQTFVEAGDVHVRFVDTGVGISPKRLEKLFVPEFARSGSRMKAGIGLFTSFNIVQKHRGRLEVESEIGKGSAFTVVLPIEGEWSHSPKTIDQEDTADRCDRLEQGRQEDVTEE
jgi:AhpD family alkylhydroperoxidase